MHTSPGVWFLVVVAGLAFAVWCFTSRPWVIGGKEKRSRKKGASAGKKVDKVDAGKLSS